MFSGKTQFLLLMSDQMKLFVHEKDGGPSMFSSLTGYLIHYIIDV